jgi:hypothetical protein
MKNEVIHAESDDPAFNSIKILDNLNQIKKKNSKTVTIASIMNLKFLLF